MAKFVTVDKASFKKAINDRQKALLLALNKRLKKLTRQGLKIIRAIAPKDSGRTVRSIGIKRNGFISRTIQVPNPRRGSSTKMDFRLVGWMHTSPKARGHIKSGRHDFVYRTIKHLRKLGGRMFRIRLKQ